MDIVFSHRPDYETPIEEVCRAFSDVIEQGLAHYWGTSEWRPEMIVRAIEICRHNGWHAPQVEQPQYNLFVRERFEKEYEYLFKSYRYGTTIWSPLCQGLLTGKYNDGNFPEGSRFSGEFTTKNILVDKYFSEKQKEESVRRLQGLGKLAEKYGCSQAQLALAWALANKDVSVALVGATRVSQIEDNLKALELLKKWSTETEKEIEELFGNKPTTEIDFKNGWVQGKGRRETNLDLP